MNIGIDFGTTNTAACYINEQGKPEALTFGHDGQERYVPSVVAVRAGNRAREYIGVEAKGDIGRPNVTIYQNFKMLLGESEHTVRQYWTQQQQATPDLITEKYLGYLLGKISAEHNITPQRIVVTIPEIWQGQNLLSKRERLIAAFKTHSNVDVQVESEPLAAAAYFIHAFKEKKQATFAGHLLVCDCGGGTMDFCLVEVSQSNGSREPVMKPLVRTGNGKVDGALGSAGVAFDQAVVQRLFPGLIDTAPERYHQLVRDFESNKIIKEKDVTEILDSFRIDPDLVEDEDIFWLHDNTKAVYAKDLVEVFDKNIAPGIKQALKDVREHFDSIGVDSLNPEKFRVLMVGGFSSFCLVRECIRSEFGNKSSVDNRFEDVLTLQDRSFAIAKGAALIAERRVEIIHTAPVDIGITITDNEGPAYVTIIEKGEDITKYKSPVWAERYNCLCVFFVPMSSVFNKSFPLFISPLDKAIINVPLTGVTLENLIPKAMSEKFNIGFSIDDDMNVYIHVRDHEKNNQMKSTTLGNVLEQLPSVIIDVTQRS